MGDPLPPLRIGPHEAPVIPDVLEEHLEELAFLSIQRRKLVFSPDVPLPDFLPHDGRILAHWKGLELGGEASVQIALTRLEAFDPWEVYAAARVWLGLGRRMVSCAFLLHGGVGSLGYYTSIRPPVK